MGLLIPWFPFQDTLAIEMEWRPLETSWIMKLKKTREQEVDKEPQSLLERDYKSHRRGGSFGQEGV